MTHALLTVNVIQQYRCIALNYALAQTCLTIYRKSWVYCNYVWRSLYLQFYRYYIDNDLILVGLKLLSLVSTTLKKKRWLSKCIITKLQQGQQWRPLYIVCKLLTAILIGPWNSSSEIRIQGIQLIKNTIVVIRKRLNLF